MDALKILSVTRFTREDGFYEELIHEKLLGTTFMDPVRTKIFRAPFQKISLLGIIGSKGLISRRTPYRIWSRPDSRDPVSEDGFLSRRPKEIGRDPIYEIGRPGVDLVDGSRGSKFVNCSQSS